MFKFLFVMFFFFLLLVFLMGFSVLRTVKNILFGSGNKGKKSGGQRRQESDYSSGSRGHSASAGDYNSRQASRKKIFAKEEGEYVDYEEVK